MKPFERRKEEKRSVAADWSLKMAWLVCVCSKIINGAGAMGDEEGRYSQVNDTVIETSVEVHASELDVFFLELSLRAGSIFNRERETGLGRRDKE